MALTDRQMVRLNIGDTAGISDKQIFDDDDIDEFLTRNNSNVNLASANACLAIAAQSALLAKAERIGNYELDRRSMAKQYRDLAKQFQEWAESEPAIDVAEINLSPFQAEEILVNEATRDY